MTTNQDEVRDWEKEFDENFPEWEAEMGNAVAHNQCVRRFKKFAATLLAQKREEIEKLKREDWYQEGNRNNAIDDVLKILS